MTAKHPAQLLEALMVWRDSEMQRRNVETYRVCSNSVLEAIAAALPRDKDELCAIKGIKEAKFRQYGKHILALVAPYLENQEQNTRNGIQDTIYKEGPTALVPDVPHRVPDTLSVSQFLDGLNLELSGMAARIRGEISEWNIWNNKFIFFSLKDSEDGSVLKCGMPFGRYQLCGLDVQVGDEVMVEGFPKMYKQRGELSLQVGTIEYAGEGALKKAYDALKAKLEHEGLLAPEKKQPLPRFPKRIALITSPEGAAIGDFTTNIGRQGLQIDFYPTGVEGQRAVFEMIHALRYFRRHAKEYDLLVMIRGGGSLESLQAFNNEALIRELASHPLPTLLGVGHERDITLSALAADSMVSTPTAAARALREPWEEARGLVRHFAQQLPLHFEHMLADVRQDILWRGEALLGRLGEFGEYADSLKRGLSERLLMLHMLLREGSIDQQEGGKKLAQLFTGWLEQCRQRVTHAGERLEQYDPTRVLRLGYSLVKQGGHIIKEAAGLRPGDILDIELSRGKLSTRVEKIIT